MSIDFVMPKSGGRVLSERELAVLEVVKRKWPTTPVEVASLFKEDVVSRDDRRKASSKYAYYLKRLAEEQEIFLKRMGNTLVAWPVDVEKYRLLDELWSVKFPRGVMLDE